MNIGYTVMDERGLDQIGPLWQKLNDHHRERSPHHAAHYVGMTFEVRKKHLLEKSQKGSMRIDIARDADTHETVGYCVSTVSENHQGEIDSIFIEQDYRRHGIGDRLMKRALGWMNELCITQRMVEVAAGNEEVFAFYHWYGFYPKSTILRTVEEKKRSRRSETDN
jgi:diamine N-acetyltransferase